MSLEELTRLFNFDSLRSQSVIWIKFQGEPAVALMLIVARNLGVTWFALRIAHHYIFVKLNRVIIWVSSVKLALWRESYHARLIIGKCGFNIILRVSWRDTVTCRVHVYGNTEAILSTPCDHVSVLHWFTEPNSKPWAIRHFSLQLQCLSRVVWFNL